jgi:hypothetical protein
VAAHPGGGGGGGRGAGSGPAAGISGAHDDRFAVLIASAAIAVAFAVTLVPAGEPAGGEPAAGEPAAGAPGSPVSLPTQPERPGAP